MASSTEKKFQHINWEVDADGKDVNTRKIDFKHI